MTLLVLDGNSIINRAFYGIKLLTTKNGDYTNAVYGFLNMMLRFEDICKPDAVAVAFDLHAPTFRHKMYDAYKAGRHAMPDELRSQMPVVKNLLKLLGIKVLECEGWEADDILGTLAEACREKGDSCYLATGDRDSLQLAHDGVKVLLARTKSTDVMDEKTIFETYGVEPHDLIQVKALQGDSSDNIPGVKGIGEKTALDLISRFKTVDYIYEHIDEITRSINKIQDYMANVSNVWQGNDATSYVNKFRNEAIPELQNYVKIMKDYQKFLSEVYPIYKSLDEYYDKSINI